MHSTLRRAAIAAATAGLVLVAAASGTAHAHASIQLYGENAVPGGYGAIFVRIPHGCTGGLATDTVTVTIPAGFASVRPMDLAGWSESRAMSGSTVTSVTWSGGSLSNAAFLDFGISVRFPTTAGTYGLVTTQQCGDTTTTWSGEDTPSITVAPRTQPVDIAASTDGHHVLRVRADASAVHAGDATTIRAVVEGRVVKRWKARFDAHGDLDRSLPNRGKTASGAAYDLSKGATIELVVDGAVVATAAIGATSAAHGH
jgi:uncharacterized protein YcnI